MENINSVYTLLYLSTSINTDTAAYDLDKILTKSRENNKKKNITGVLVYANGVYLQVIEGNKDDIIELYKKIVSDSTHYGVIKIWEGYCEKRTFEKWSMGFKLTSKDEITKHLLGTNEVENSDFVELIKSEQTKILSFIHSFYENNF